MSTIIKSKQYYKFSVYGFLKNLRFFDAFFILFLVENGMSYSQIGTLYAIREIIIHVFEIPSGIIADSFGRKSSLVASFIIYTMSFALFYFSSEFWWFVMAFSLYGIADAFRSGTHKGMIMDYLKLNSWSSQKIKYYGYTRSWSQKGSAISSLIAGVLVFYSGDYKNIFLYSIIPYLLNLFIILSYPAALNHSNTKKKKKNLSITYKSLVNILKQPHVLSLINTSALHSAYLKAVKDYIQPIMVQIAIMIPLFMNIAEEKKNGLFIGVFYFLIYLITSRSSQLASRISSKSIKSIPFITLGLGLAFGIIGGFFYEKQFWVIAMMFIIGIYIIENIRKPILTGYVSDHVPNEILTSVLSAQSLLKTIITAVLAVGFGLFADAYGIGVSFIIVSTILFILSSIIEYIGSNNK